MLVLSRKMGQEVIIGDNIRVTVVAIRGNQVRLGFSAPANVSICRSELPGMARVVPDREMPAEGASATV